MAKASKTKQYVSEYERNRRIRTRVFTVLPLVFIALSIAAVLFVLFSKQTASINNLLIYASTGLMDTAMFLIAIDSILWVFANDGAGRKVFIFFAFLLFLAGTVYAWVHWNRMAGISNEINSLYDTIHWTATSASEIQSAQNRIDVLTEQRMSYNLNIIFLQLIRLFALCGCLLISWTGSKKQEFGA